MSQVSTFEAVAIGLGYNIDSWEPDDPGHHSELRNRIQNLWGEQAFREKQGSGVRGTDRIISIIPFARAYFKR